MADPKTLAELIRGLGPDQLAAVQDELLVLTDGFDLLAKAADQYVTTIAKAKDATSDIATSQKVIKDNYTSFKTDEEILVQTLEMRQNVLQAITNAIPTHVAFAEELIASDKERLNYIESQAGTIDGIGKSLQQQTLDIEKSNAKLRWSDKILSSVGANLNNVSSTLVTANKTTSKMTTNMMTYREQVDATEKALQGFVQNLFTAEKTKLMFAGFIGALKGADIPIIGKAFNGAAQAIGDFTSSMVTGGRAAYEEVSTLTTGFASLTGQVMDSDMAVRKAGRGTTSFAQRVIQLQKDNQLLGITLKDVTAAYEGLIKTSRTAGLAMASNSLRGRNTIDILAEQAMRFKKVGLETETFASAIDILGKTYRRSDITNESKALATQFVNIGRATGQLPDKVGKDFANAMTTLAAYTLPQAKEMFKKLSATVAVTGVEMDKLLGIAGKFDDMEQAANMVGELNAMLQGPYLNTLDLVNATEEERIEILKNAMDQTGQNFNEMDRFMKKSIAQQLGTDVQTAARLFSGQQEQVEKVSKSIDSQGASYDNLAQAAADNATGIKEQNAAVSQSMVLFDKAYGTVDRLYRRLNTGMMGFGNRFKKNIGQSILTVLKTGVDATVTAYRTMADIQSGAIDITTIAGATQATKGLASGFAFGDPFGAATGGKEGAAKTGDFQKALAMTAFFGGGDIFGGKEQNLPTLVEDVATVNKNPENPTFDQTQLDTIMRDLFAGGHVDPTVAKPGGAGPGGLGTSAQPFHIENVIMIDGKHIRTIVNEAWALNQGGG